MKPSPIAQNDMPNSKAPRKPSKLSKGKAPEMDNDAKTSGYEQPAVATNRNPHQDKAVDSDANEPPAEPQASPEILRKAQDYEQPTADTNMNPHEDNPVDGDAIEPPAEPQASPEILRKAQDY